MIKPVHIKLSKGKALEIIRELAQNSGNVIFLTHALQRMRKRKVTPREIIICLEKGLIIEGPALDLHGKWKVTLERFGAGRKLNVVVAIDLPKKLLVITVFEGEV